MLSSIRDPLALDPPAPCHSPIFPAASSSFCRIIVNCDLERARLIISISPLVINLRHPLGWAPLHAAALCRSPQLLKILLDQPDTDIQITDKSKFGSPSESSPANIQLRAEELSPSLLGSASTAGATALHFACMAGDWEAIRLLLDAGASHDAKDDSGRYPLEYFDLLKVSLDTYKAYNDVLSTWRARWRFLNPKDVTILGKAIRRGDFEQCKEILKSKPALANEAHIEGWRPLHMAIVNQRPEIVDLILTHSSAEDVNHRHRCGLTSNVNLEFATDEFAHRAMYGATALHYACLIGDMGIAEKLIRAGADWEKVDGHIRTPMMLIDTSRGDETVATFKKLCEDEKERKRIQKEREEENKREDRRKDDTPDNAIGHNEEGDYIEREDGDDVGSSESKSNAPMTEKQKTIEEVIGAKIIGQQGPIRAVSSAIRLREHGWMDPDRPLVMLFLGSSGVGKTEVAKQIAYYLHGKGLKGTNPTECQSINDIEKSGAFIRIDMSEYQGSHTVSNLTGSPKGYVGYEEGGILTSKLRKNSKAVVLLDEIEKAHPDVLTVFLQVFDDGRVTDPKHGTVYCKDAVFIMTSNLASEKIRAHSPMLRALVAQTDNAPEQYSRVIRSFNRNMHPVLKKAFRRDEFLGRINQIIVFLPLSEDEIRVVVQNELKMWSERAALKHAIKVSWATPVVNKLVEAYDVNYGVRSVVNEVHKVAISLIAEAHIRGDIEENWLVHLDIGDKGEIVLNKENPIGSSMGRSGCRLLFY